MTDQSHSAMDRRGGSEDATDRVADAPARNWVDRFAPRRVRPYLRLSRADRPIGTWLLLLPGWWSLALSGASWGWTEDSLWLFVAFAIGAALMRGAGCVWNDVTDRDIDGRVARTRSRPIPSGQVSVPAALAWGAAQALAAFAILLTFNGTAIALGVLSLLPVAIYPFMKRVTWWPQIFLGLAFNWGALLAWAARTGSVDWPPALLYIAGICWTLHYDTIYAHQDKEDDALIGVRSTARLFGKRTGNWLIVFSLASTGYAALAATTALGAGPALWTALGGVALFGLHLAWQILRLRIDDSDRCLALFRANRDSGLILVAAFALASLV